MRQNNPIVQTFNVSDPDNSRRSDTQRNRVLSYIKSMEDPTTPGTYRISASNPVDLFACAYVPQILALLNCLDWLNDSKKDSLVTKLQNYQDEEGYFTSNTSVGWQPHVREMNLLLMSSIASSSLGLLGHSPLKKMRFLNKVLNQDRMRSWFDERRCKGLTREESWNESIATQALGVCLLVHAYHKGIDLTRWDIMQVYFDCLEALQDQYTGFWGVQLHPIWRLYRQISISFRGETPDYLFSMMGTSFHMVDIFTACNRPVPFAEKIAINTIRCQQPDGLFYPGGSTQCHDLDAISMLANLYKQTNKMIQVDIQRALLKAEQAFISYGLQNPDGGFRNRAGGEPYKKGDAPLYIRQGESDLLSTWFRLAAIAYIDLTLGCTSKQLDFTWNFPNIGFIHYST